MSGSAFRSPKRQPLQIVTLQPHSFRRRHASNLRCRVRTSANRHGRSRARHLPHGPRPLAQPEDGQVPTGPLSERTAQTHECLCQIALPAHDGLLDRRARLRDRDVLCRLQTATRPMRRCAVPEMAWVRADDPALLQQGKSGACRCRCPTRAPNR
jgi:hypothetical protein